jgi:hypothetical protein
MNIIIIIIKYFFNTKRCRVRTMETKGKEQLPPTKWYEWIMAFSIVVVAISVMA